MDAGLSWDPPAPYNRTPAITAMVVMTNLGPLTMLMTPAMIVSYTGTGHFSAGQAATLTSAELAAMTAVMLLTSSVIHRIDRRRWVALGLLLAASAHLASIFVTAYPLLLAIRFVAGAGIGVAYTVAVAALSATAQPDRNFGVSVTANQLAATAVLTTCSWVGLNHGHGPTLAVVFVFTLLTALGIPWFPRRAPALAMAEDSGDVAARATGIVPGLIGLGGMSLFLLGVGMVWPVVGLIAQSHGIASSTVGSALALAGLGGITAGLLVSALGARLGRIIALAIGSSGIAAGVLLLLVAYDGWTLIMVAPIIMFFWMFDIPYYLGAMSVLDGSGRLAVVGSATAPLGLAAGQAITATIVHGSNYTPVIAVSATLFVVALTSVVIGLTAGSRLKPSAGTSKHDR
ncbi:MFS transporter [Neorhizobium galegae]|nr:MFS transporter [Neorhizobium galegae]